MPIFFFVAAIAGYQLHGIRRTPTTRSATRCQAPRAFMIALIVGEIGGFAVLLAGFVDAQIL